MELLRKYFEMYQSNVTGAVEFQNWSSKRILIEYCFRPFLCYCE